MRRHVEGSRLSCTGIASYVQAPGRWWCRGGADVWTGQPEGGPRAAPVVLCAHPDRGTGSSAGQTPTDSVRDAVKCMFRALATKLPVSVLGGAERSGCHLAHLTLRSAAFFCDSGRRPGSARTGRLAGWNYR